MSVRPPDRPLLIDVRAAASIALLLASVMATGCSKNTEEASSAYQAACHGQPLRTIERREEAMQNGYNINSRFDCIDKASYVAVNRQKARWQAANTPEAIAEREATRARLVEEEQARRSAAAGSQPVASVSPRAAVAIVDVNTATESELASVVSLGPVVAAQIMRAREHGRFENWQDLVRRVVALSAARTAVSASICGLNVDGQSLQGAAPDPRLCGLQ